MSIDSEELKLKLKEYYKVLASMHFDILDFTLNEKPEQIEECHNLGAALRVTKIFTVQLGEALEAREKPILNILKIVR